MLSRCLVHLFDSRFALPLFLGFGCLLFFPASFFLLADMHCVGIAMASLLAGGLMFAGFCSRMGRWSAVLLTLACAALVLVPAAGMALLETHMIGVALAGILLGVSLVHIHRPSRDVLHRLCRAIHMCHD